MTINLSEVGCVTIVAKGANKESRQARWDYEADVVVCGYGGAGAVAAIVAHDSGSRVLVLEKQAAEKHTPNTRMSAGGSLVSNNVEDAARYFKAVAFGAGLPSGYGDPPRAYPKYQECLTEEVARNFAEGLVETSRFLRSLGATDLEEKIPRPGFPSFPGAKSCGSFRFRLHKDFRGRAFFEVLTKAVSDRDIFVLWETPARRLMINPQGRVIGVKAQSGRRTST